MDLMLRRAQLLRASGYDLEHMTWAQVAALATKPEGPLIAKTKTSIFHDTHESTAVDYDQPWVVADLDTGTLVDSTTAPVVIMQSLYCLPFDTQLSPYQGFLHAIDGLPAGTYNVTFASNAGNDGMKGKSFQFTLSSALPAGGVLAGFRGYATNKVYVHQSQYDASPTDVAVSEGSGGTALGTITVAGVPVPASGIPETVQTVTIDGTDYTYYGLNSVHRIAYGNNRWLHSPLRRWLNATDADWWEPATVFDLPPTYVRYPGFLSMLPADLVAVMLPVRQATALNYVTDGGTSASPEFDVTYDKVFLPSWEQHYLTVGTSYGGTSGIEGASWDYWKRAYGSSTPPIADNTVSAYVQYDMASHGTACACWMRSANRQYGYGIARVYSSGRCSYSYAYNGYRATPACAISTTMLDLSTAPKVKAALIKAD